MNDERKKTLRHHIAAAARDILVVLTVISIFMTAIVTLTKPYWEPFAEIPSEMKELRIEVARLQASVDSRLTSQIIDFHGGGQIVGPTKVRRGGRITVLYSLRRNASCETDVSRTFYNVTTGTFTQTGLFRAVKASVSKQFQLFKVEVDVPASVVPGEYVYRPTLHPVDCGIYENINIPPTNIFEVTE